MSDLTNRSLAREAMRIIKEADAVLISASNGLSISEGYHIFADNDDFKEYFGEFRAKYGVDCLIRGVFANMTPEDHERYMQTVHRYLIDDYRGSDVMKDLLKIVEGKDYVIVTSNGDRHFQMNGFDENRIFEIEGNFDKVRMYDPEWQVQQQRFNDFVSKYRSGNVALFELGIGMRNRMIKKPLMDMVEALPEWRYITLNMPQEIYVPAEIADRSVAIPGNIAETFKVMIEEGELL